MQRTTFSVLVRVAATLMVAGCCCVPPATAQNSILVREPVQTLSPITEPPRQESTEGFLSLTGPAGADPAADTPIQSNLVEEPSLRRSVAQVALQATVDTPKQLRVGGESAVQIKLTNAGDSPSKTARVFVGIPPTVEFISASPTPLSQTSHQIEFAVDGLGAGQSQELQLIIRPTVAANLEFQVLTMPVVEQPIALAVAGPSLNVETLSPREALLQSQFIQGVTLENPSSSEITNVAVTAFIPEGLNVAKLNRDAEIDLESRVVTWRLERLSPQAREAFQFIAVAESPGAQLTRLTVTSDGAELQTVELATEITHAPAEGGR